MSILSKFGTDSTKVSPMIRYFFRELEIPKLLRKCNFNKEKGVAVIEVFLAILSTDTSISDKEIARIYGLRWDIEMFSSLPSPCYA